MLLVHDVKSVDKLKRGRIYFTVDKLQIEQLRRALVDKRSNFINRKGA